MEEIQKIKKGAKKRIKIGIILIILYSIFFLLSSYLLLSSQGDVGILMILVFVFTIILSSVFLVAIFLVINGIYVLRKKDEKIQEEIDKKKLELNSSIEKVSLKKVLIFVLLGIFLLVTSLLFSNFGLGNNDSLNVIAIIPRLAGIIFLIFGIIFETKRIAYNKYIKEKIIK